MPSLNDHADERGDAGASDSVISIASSTMETARLARVSGTRMAPAAEQWRAGDAEDDKYRPRRTWCRWLAGSRCFGLRKRKLCATLGLVGVIAWVAIAIVGRALQSEA